MLATGLQTFIGMWFGVALAAYFLVVNRDRSIGKALGTAIGLVAVSAAAYLLAYMTALFSEAFVFRDTVTSAVGPHSGSLFVGGAVGTFIMSTTTFFMYGERCASRRHKIYACTLGGGVLGAAGIALGTAMQPGSPPEPLAMAVLFIVWQTGMGFLMGLVWPVGDQETETAPGGYLRK
jgi:hypothetical protein